MLSIKKYLFILFLIALVSCNENKKPSAVPAGQQENQEVVMPPEKPEVKEVEIPEEKPGKSPESKKKKRKPGLHFLEDLIGKYPAKDRILKDHYLARRLKKLDRFDYNRMLQDWNLETPLTREASVIHSSGCLKIDCTNNAYELFIDLKTNTINIYQFRGNTMRVFRDKGWIDLPPGFKKELQTKQDLAKIGSTSDDMESKYRLRVK